MVIPDYICEHCEGSNIMLNERNGNTMGQCDGSCIAEHLGEFCI